MWFYYIALLVLIFLYFLIIFVVSEQIRKSIFVDFFTSKTISLWNYSKFSPLKHYQLGQFAELKPDASSGQLVKICETKKMSRRIFQIISIPIKKQKVLEVGAGDGANFEHYPPDCSLTVLEYNEYFEKKFKENVNKFSKIKLEKFVTGFVEDMHEFEDDTFDVVICTHVLCSVDDVPQGLEEIIRVLKEVTEHNSKPFNFPHKSSFLLQQGGKFFFVEHVAYERNLMRDKFWSMVQGLIEPIWKFAMCGCRLRKPTWLYLQNAGFSTLTITREHPKKVPGFLRPHIFGCGVK